VRPHSAIFDFEFALILAARKRSHAPSPLISGPVSSGRVVVSVTTAAFSTAAQAADVGVDSGVGLDLGQGARSQGEKLTD
jgi:hypothetical protein